MSRRVLFLTGGSGFLGAALITSLIKAKQFERIYLLLRVKKGHNGSERVRDLCERLFTGDLRPLAEKCLIAVDGDLEQGKLGLKSGDALRLQDEVTHIMHLGASTDFGAPLAESREVNVEGTRHVLDFALTCRNLKRFDYVSTAFVAGTREGRVHEDELTRRQNFANSYEQSKYEAELLVKSYTDRLPIAVYRPSIVVGDSRNGFTPHFKVLYWPLQLLSKNILPFIPCNPRARFDIVPVDFVVNALQVFMDRPDAVGHTWHLTAGFGNEVRLSTLLKDAFRYSGIIKRPIVPVWVFRLIKATPLRRLLNDDFWRAAELAVVYNEYLKGTGVRFDATKTHSILKGAGIEPKRWNDFSEPILRYCTASRWGKKLPEREYILRNPELH